LWWATAAYFNEGMRTAVANTDLKTVAPDAFVEPHDDEPIFVDLANLDPASISRGIAARQGGQFALENYQYGLELARDGRVDAVCFTPFNKKAMRLARPSYDDEIAYSAEVVGLESAASEFNILDKLWNARVTSHIPLAEVPARLTKERILRALKLTDYCMRRAGCSRTGRDPDFSSSCAQSFSHERRGSTRVSGNSRSRST
jgi:4-hydroxythreonine-4-phosphate dehydrogenase